MSHFNVAVFSKTKDDVERLLAPYDESISVAPYVEYTKAEATERGREWASKSHPDWTDEQFYEYVAEDYRDDDRIDKDGNLLTTYNPNSKWDWYSIGGRWGKHLRLKDGGMADQANARDVDFSLDKSLYDAAIHFWEFHVEGKGEVSKDDWRAMYKPDYYIEQYQTKENYANSLAMRRTYAFVKANGVWCQTGEMGWWGFDNATKASRDGYAEAYDEYVKKAQEKGLFVTVVDCHI